VYRDQTIRIQRNFITYFFFENFSGSEKDEVQNILHAETARRAEEFQSVIKWRIVRCARAS
jgi:hypothetical protein